MDNYIIAKATDVGKTRQLNEDSMTVFDSPNGQVLAVCDGMGGQAAGDVASQLAINIIENILTDNTFETPEEAIRRSVLAANQGVLHRTSQNSELEGMGSTCVMLIIKNGKVHCGWVGDSRIYYIANHTIRQLSHDQSYVQKLVDQGAITAAEALVHPQKNEIENCIGLPGMTAPETIAVPITPEPGSVFLLCSDGLSGMVDDKQIERVVSNTKMSLQEKADKLVAMANAAGGLDNITVEMVQFGTSEVVGATSGTLFDTPEGANISRKKSNKLLYSLLSALLLIILCLAGGYVYMQTQKEKDNEKALIKKGSKQEPIGDKNLSSPTPPAPSSTSDMPSQTKQSTQKADPQKVLSNKGTSNKNSTEDAIKKAKKAEEEAAKKAEEEARKAQEEADRKAKEDAAKKALEDEMKNK